VSAEGVGFAHDTNAVTIIGPRGVVAEVPLSAKGRVAEVVLDTVATVLGGTSAP
jgi:hypothetical protein